MGIPEKKRKRRKWWEMVKVIYPLIDEQRTKERQKQEETNTKGMKKKIWIIISQTLNAAYLNVCKNNQDNVININVLSNNKIYPELSTSHPINNTFCKLYENVTIFLSLNFLFVAFCCIFAGHQGTRCLFLL